MLSDCLCRRRHFGTNLQPRIGRTLFLDRLRLTSRWRSSGGRHEQLIQRLWTYRLFSIIRFDDCLLIPVFSAAPSMTTYALLQHGASVTRCDAAAILSALELEIDEQNIYVCSTSVNMPASGRRVLQDVISRLWPHDLLLLFELVTLGNNYLDVVATVGEVKKRGARVSVVCANNDRFELVTGDTLVLALSLALKMNTELRRERASEAVKFAKENGAKVGRPGSLDAAKRQRALDALAAGSSVTEIARALGTSRQTILRLRDSDIAQ